MTRMDTSENTTSPATADATETLIEVRRRIIGIHESVAESLNSDTEIVPWVERELRDLMRFISASGAAPLRPRSRPAQTDEPRLLERTS